MSESPAPGWYPDPSGVIRYWTGSEWGPAKPSVAPVSTARVTPPPTAPPASPTAGAPTLRMGSEFIDSSRPLPERNLGDIAVKPGASNVVMGFLAVLVGFPVYVPAAFLGALIGREAGVVVALILAALICFAAGWGVAQNRREELAARDAQIKMGRHLADRERR
jgi:hypothetical protein